jgi:hypothetical protein
MSNSREAQAEAALHDQTDLLPRTKLVIVFSTLALTFLGVSANQNSITVILPAMAHDLDAFDTIS